MKRKTRIYAVKPEKYKLYVINRLRPKGKTLSQEFKCPQRPNRKTLSRNAVSFLKFSASVNTCLFFTVLV